jgi:hypothetical protein
MAQFENFEKYDIMKCYIECNENAQEAVDLYFNRYFNKRFIYLCLFILLKLFSYRYPERRQPSSQIFPRIKENLINHGSFTRPRSKTYNKENRERDEITVLACVEATPTSSCRIVEREVGVPKTKVHRILRNYKFKPYKIKIVHHLHPGDAERRLVFCNWYLQQIRNNINFARTVIWSDEAYFTSSGIFNRHNTRHWTEENPHLIFERQRQGRFGFSVACFILGRQIAYRIYEGGLTGERYLDILQDVIPELLEDVPLALRNDIYFQQDGAPAHNAQQVTTFLQNRFQENWIGTNGPVRWPPRSPDISVLDFFLWGYIQHKVYRNRNRVPQELRNAVEVEFRNLRRRSVIVLNALRRITKMCQKCIRANGNHFEQFL